MKTNKEARLVIKKAISENHKYLSDKDIKDTYLLFKMLNNNRISINELIDDFK